MTDVVAGICGGIIGCVTWRALWWCLTRINKRQKGGEP
jgi:hypothetical protein